VAKYVVVINVAMAIEDELGRASYQTCQSTTLRKRFGICLQRTPTK